MHMKSFTMSFIIIKANKRKGGNSVRIYIEFGKDEEWILPATFRRVFEAYLHKITDIHGDSSPYSYDGKHYVPWVFSSIHWKGSHKREKDRMIVKGPIGIYIDSPIEVISEDIFNHFMRGGSVEMLGEKMDIYSVQAIPRYPDFSSGTLMTMAISPIVTYITLQNYKCFIYPFDERQWRPLIEDSIKRKLVAFGYVKEEELEGIDIAVKPYALDIRRNYSVASYTKEGKTSVFKGFTGLYKLEGHPKALEMAYRSGIGSRNGIGFGMLKEYTKSRKTS